MMKNILKTTFFILFSISILLIISNFKPFIIKAQVKETSPLIYTTDERNFKLTFNTNPMSIISGQKSQLNLSLVDSDSDIKIQHVTYHITVTKDNQVKISNFFHSHAGNLTISIPDYNSSSINVEGNFDPLTNAFVPDPSGIIEITGPLFLQKGVYKINIEITTIDNDKTVLSIPLEYQYNIIVKNKNQIGNN